MNSNNPEPQSLTATLTDTLQSIRFGGLPATAITLAKHCFLDWLGVTLAGSNEPAVTILKEEARTQGGKPQSSLLGSQIKTSNSWAALINGTSSHALDFDDVVARMSGHPSVPLFPAVLALAEEGQYRGKDFIASFVAGFEAECRIGALLAPSHYTRGFHATATVGAFGAAAACSHLMRLNRQQWQVAFGLAGTQAAGLKSMFGTMTKPFHAGKASANGLLASRLAASGFTAHPEVLEVDQGFGVTHADSLTTDAVYAELDSAFGIEGVLFKYHAACYLTHASIDALKALRAEHSFCESQIKSVQLYVPPRHLKVCNIEDPTTGLEGKFSLRFTAALALASLDTGEEAFTDSAVHNEDLVSLRDKVSVVSKDSLSSEYKTEVKVILDTGEALTTVGDVSQPAKHDQLDDQWERLVNKFETLVTPLIGKEDTKTIVQLVHSLEDVEDMSQIPPMCVLGSR